MTDTVTQGNEGTINAPPDVSNSETVAEEYVVTPRNGHDEIGLAATAQLLKQLTHPPDFFLDYRDVNGALLLWLVKITEAQANELGKHEGIERIEKNRDIAKDQAK